MKFHVIRPPTLNPAQSPIRIVEQATGREVGWVDRYLDREYVRRVADTTLRTWAYNLLHFVRWWESLHHTGDVVEGDLTESTLLDYVKFQSSQHLRLPVPPSMTASPSPIAPFATSSPTPPAKWPAASIMLFCTEGPWAWAGHG